MSRLPPRAAAGLVRLLLLAPPLLVASALPAQPRAPARPAPSPAIAPAAAAPATGAAQCLGFAFGRWTPALDARAAGHDAAARTAHPQAPNGRDWAAAIGAGRDTTLMLFPAWWPAGVHIDVPASRPGRDTVHATATALVADGRVRAPTAAVLMWVLPCG